MNIWGQCKYFDMNPDKLKDFAKQLWRWIKYAGTVIGGYAQDQPFLVLVLCTNEQGKTAPLHIVARKVEPKYKTR